MRRRYRLAVIAVMSLVVASACLGAGTIECKSTLSSVGCQTKETSLGDLVADAARSVVPGAQIALVPAGGFREVTIPKGTVSISDVTDCLQYPGDALSVIDITGAQLLSGLERSVALNPQRNLGFLQVSGMTVRFDPSAPKGSRVASVRVGVAPLNVAATYRVVTTEALARGDYGYFTIWGKVSRSPVKDKTLAGAVNDMLAGRNSIDYGTLDRIIASK